MSLSDIVANYVAYKQALGQKFTTDAGILNAFCRYVGNVPLQSISAEQVERYLNGKRPISSFWRRKHTALKGLFRFATSRGYTTISPLPCRYPQIPLPLAPYIYSRTELKRLLDAIPAGCSRHVPVDTIVIRTLILLLYGACLRLGEALGLTMSDVDVDEAILCIQKSKFYKSRLVPLGQDLNTVLHQYIQQRNISYSQESNAPLFCFQDGRVLSQSATRNTFRRLRVLAGIQQNGTGHCQPRLHDLRHTGAVHRVIAWYQNGDDLQFMLPQLATYLGHINLSATQRYLSLTPELLREASQRFEQYTLEPSHD